VFHEGRLYVAIGRDIQYTRKSGGRGLGPGAVTCIDPSGSGDVTDSHILWQNREVGRTQATPSVVNGLLYVASLDGCLYCLDIADGSTVYKYDLERAISERSQLVADGKVYVGTDGGELFVFRAGREPKLLFQTRLPALPSTPVACGDVIIVAHKRGVHAYRKGAGAEARHAAAAE
jgi:outer membrane protein assembly factor BamB